jgi:4-hydroxy-4-methyl-2-oxoglutarate aldolase
LSKQTLPPDVLEALRTYDSATIANAIEHFKVRDRTTGYANNELVCQFPQPKPMVGYAVTCIGDTTMPGDTRKSGVADLVDLVDAAPKPVVVVIQAAGHERARMCYLGDMFTATMSKLGCVGVVTDGNCRDRSGIQQRTPDFHLFSRGWVVSHGYGAYYNFNTTVTVAGLTVEPGDLLHGDESGVLKVPTEVAEPALERARELRNFEQEYFRYLKSDEFDMEEMKRRFAPP